MSQTASSFKQQKYDAGVTRVAMNLEVDVIPVSDAERSKQSTNTWVGGSTRMTPRQRTFASSSSRHPAQGARLPSATD